MQLIVQDGSWVCGIVLGEEALIHCSSSCEHEERATGSQSPPADRLSHRLREADGEEHEQQAKDYQIGVQNPCIPSYAKIADHLMYGRVAWTQEAINGEHEHKKDGTDCSSRCE